MALHTSPFFGYLFANRNKAATVVIAQGVESLFQTRRSPLIVHLISVANLFNASADFPHGDGANEKVGLFRVVKPLQDTGIRGSPINL
jgi:hypothetical protein